MESTMKAEEMQSTSDGQVSNTKLNVIKERVIHASTILHDIEIQISDINFEIFGKINLPKKEIPDAQSIEVDSETIGEVPNIMQELERLDEILGKLARTANGFQQATKV